MKLLVVSDSHGSVSVLGSILEIHADADMIIHCGDGIGDLHGMAGDSPLITVPGNMDVKADAGEAVQLIEVASKRIMVTHGHLFGVKFSTDKLFEEALALEADCVLFGHTHRQFVSYGQPCLMNPGTVQAGCYGIVHINDEACVCDLKSL